MPCEKCELFGGLWMETPRGLRRCDCLPPIEKPTAHAPVLTAQQTTVFVEMLASIPFFPGESGARMAIGNELSGMCTGTKEAAWLVTQMRRLYDRWPGPAEMRRVYDNTHIPWDGIQSIGESEVYPSGIPSDRTSEPKQLAAPAYRMIAERKHEIIHDAKVQRGVQALTERARRMPVARNGSEGGTARLREILTAPNDRPQLPGSAPQIITAEDVRREVEKLRAAKAEMGTP